MPQCGEWNGRAQIGAGGQHGVGGIRVWSKQGTPEVGAAWC